MSAAVACSGYAEATIAQAIAHAGVSRPTFYDYFDDKRDCFVATLTSIQGCLTDTVHQSVAAEEPEQALHAAVAALVRFAATEQSHARLLLNEVMAAGPRALDVRDDGLGVVAQIISDEYERADPATAVPDLDPRLLLGGVYRLLGSRLRKDDLDATAVADDLRSWITSYQHPLSGHRWRTVEPISPPSPSPALGRTLRAPSPLPPGRAPRSKAEVADHHRRRIVLAAAQLAEQKGYTDTTITDITTLARVDVRVFYRHFADKRDAFRALHEFLFRETIAATAAGFVSGETWPTRIWEAARAFSRYMEHNPTLAYASFVDSHAGEPVTVERVEALVRGFTLFLQEGFQHASLTDRPSPLALEGIATMVFELDYRLARECRIRQLSGLVPHVAFMALTPFIGPAGANAFIDSQLARETPRDDA